MTVDYLHLCEWAFLNEHGRHCLIGLFTGVEADSFPLKLPTMCVGVCLRDAPRRQLAFTLVLLGPTGKPITTGEVERVTDGDGELLLTVRFFRLELPEPGRYTVEVREGERVLSSRRLDVRKSPASPARVH